MSIGLTCLAMILSGVCPFAVLIFPSLSHHVLLLSFEAWMGSFSDERTRTDAFVMEVTIAVSLFTSRMPDPYLELGHTCRSQRVPF